MAAASPMLDVVGVGASSVDFVYLLPATPVPDSPTAKLRISDRLVSPGGQTVTTLCACARLGLRTRFVGVVGSDEYAPILLETLRARGVDTSTAIVREGPSPYAVILIDEHHGERVVLWSRAPAATLSPADVVDADLAGARVVHVDDVDIEAAIDVAGRARALGAVVTSDIEQATPDARRLVREVDVVMLAEHVPPALAPAASMEDSLRALRSRADQMMCVTLGRRGAMLLAGDRVHAVPGHPIRAVDTTGAGDVFRGAFIAALLRGEGPGQVLCYANAAAAASCTRLGAAAGVPADEEVRALLDGPSGMATPAP